MDFNQRQWEYLKNLWHLTPRETDVAKLVCKGMNNEQIARQLNIKYNTVRVHLVNIFKKTGVSGKAAMTVKFIDVIQKLKD